MPRLIPTASRMCRFAMASAIGVIVSITALRADDAQLCDRAARQAAAATGVPITILQAITRIETGRSRENRTVPWPWTVNMEGTGHWFATAAEAIAFARSHHAVGASRFDVGCFQINYGWHGDRFTSLSAMFDPDENAHYAARFLAELHRELGQWDAAVAAYHSRTPQHGARYLGVYRQQMAELEAMGATPPRRSDTVMATHRPLVIGPRGDNGSLMPVTAHSTGRLFGARP